MFPKVTFVIGGAASGKSVFAEQLVQSCGRPKVYLATGQAFDDEMQDRIDRHVARRGEDWDTIEAPMDAERHLTEMSGDQVCLLDCATLWLSNQMMAETDIDLAQEAFLAAIDACPAAIVVVSNEVGQGIVPEKAIARTFRNIQGQLNCALAARADLVVLVTAGIPQVLKGQMP